jgi:DNA ligase-associated metallophosphoesterase
MKVQRDMERSMNDHSFTLMGAKLSALPSGALFWPEKELLAVGDLHLGRAERTAREGGGMLPPYETTHTLDRLEAVIIQVSPKTIVLLGDTFDDMRVLEHLAEDVLERLRRIAAGRRLVWIAGNHDPGPVELPGTFLGALREKPLTFRHIADQSAEGEVSGHYHPKVRLRLRGQFISRSCFLVDRDRVILPAFGTYTGGLDVSSPPLTMLMHSDAKALLTGRQVTALPLSVC